MKRVVDYAYSNNILKCSKCGHTQRIWRKFCLCDHCGTMVFGSKKEEYDYRIKRKLGKLRNEKINN